MNFLAAGIIEQYDKKTNSAFFAPIIPASTGYNWDDTILFENLTLFGVKYCITCGVTALQVICTWDASQLLAIHNFSMQAIQKLCRGVHDKGMNETQHDYCI